MNKPMIILVHGGCHTASCWDRLLPELRAFGRDVLAIDLPGHGRDPVSEPTPKSLEDGIVTVVDAIHAVRSPVMLVGHSLGGMTISGAAERIAERIARLVYLTALVPRDGDSAADFGQLAGFNASVGSEMLEDGERAGVKTELARHLFYADCDRQTAERAVAALVATDLSYLTTPVTVSPDRFGVIPKTYILCLRDNAIEPRAQRVLATVHPGTDICEIDAGHSAFLSRPRELAALIDRL